MRPTAYHGSTICGGSMGQPSISEEGNRLGRFCILCSRIRPNEAFGGKGERARVCRKCRRMPREKRDTQLREREILGFLEQSHISPKNLAHLPKESCTSASFEAIGEPTDCGSCMPGIRGWGSYTLSPPADPHSGAGTSRCFKANGGTRSDHAAASTGGYGPVRHRPSGCLARMGRIRTK
jgi:hypothetical protein